MEETRMKREKKYREVKDKYDKLKKKLLAAFPHLKEVPSQILLKSQMITELNKEIQDKTNSNKSKVEER